jgi:hypothetical protein
MPEDVTTRSARCGACRRPVWPAPPASGAEAPAPPPELCDYCAVAAS